MVINNTTEGHYSNCKLTGQKFGLMDVNEVGGNIRKRGQSGKEKTN